MVSPQSNQNKIYGTNNKKLKKKNKFMENTNNESLKGVKILRSFYEALDEFTYEEKGRMFEAIMEYGLNGVEPKFDDADDARALKAIWKTYLPVVNNSISRAIASAKNGSKGGAPKKSNETTRVSSNTQTETKATTATISTQDIPEVQLKEKVSEIEENELKNTNIFDMTLNKIRENGYSTEKIGNWVIPNLLLPYVDNIKPYTGIMKDLSKENSQLNFEIELKRKIKQATNN